MYEDEINDEIYKEIIYTYGSSVYMAQRIEKMLIGITIDSSIMTESRFRELLYHRYGETIGSIVKMIDPADGIFDADELKEINKFVVVRNDLVHNFMTDRAVQIAKEPLRGNVLSQLKKIETDFYQLKEMILNKGEKGHEERGLDTGKIIENLMEGDETPTLESFIKIKKYEKLIDVKAYKLTENLSIPIFILEGSTYCTICESGLTQYKEEIDFSKVEDIELPKGVFPIEKFNTKPDKVSNWNYDLMLNKKGLKISVKSTIEGHLMWMVEQEAKK